MSWLAVRRLLYTGARVASRDLRGASTASGRGKGQYSAEKETHFGFENVSEEEKAQKGAAPFPSHVNCFLPLTFNSFSWPVTYLFNL